MTAMLMDALAVATPGEIIRLRASLLVAAGLALADGAATAAVYAAVAGAMDHPTQAVDPKLVAAVVECSHADTTAVPAVFAELVGMGGLAIVLARELREAVDIASAQTAHIDQALAAVETPADLGWQL